MPEDRLNINEFYEVLHLYRTQYSQANRARRSGRDSSANRSRKRNAPAVAPAARTTLGW